MGWTTAPRPEGMSLRDFIGRLFRIDNEDTDQQMLDCVIDRVTTAYVAVKRVNKATGRRAVFGGVVELGWGAQYGGSVTHKWLHEEMGPVRKAAPKRILRLLTPAENDLAREWRAACEERILNQPIVVI